jgi:hypothetical protein
MFVSPEEEQKREENEPQRHRGTEKRRRELIE